MGKILSRLSELTVSWISALVCKGTGVLLSWASRSPRSCGGWRTQHGRHSLRHGQEPTHMGPLLPAQTTQHDLLCSLSTKPNNLPHLSFPAWMTYQALKTVSIKFLSQKNPSCINFLQLWGLLSFSVLSIKMYSRRYVQGWLWISRVRSLFSLQFGASSWGPVLVSNSRYQHAVSLPWLLSTVRLSILYHSLTPIGLICSFSFHILGLLWGIRICFNEKNRFKTFTIFFKVSWCSGFSIGVITLFSKLLKLCFTVYLGLKK